MTETLELICKHENKKTIHKINGLLITEADKKYLSKKCYEEFKETRLYTCLSCKSTFAYKPEDLPC